MTTYFTADWHLGHARIIELCSRPFVDAAQMNRQIIRNMNDVVGEDDTLIILGDVVMGQYAANVELLSALRSRRVLIIPGNHDRFSLAYRGNETAREAARMALVNLGLWAQEDRRPSQWETTIGGHMALLSHYPYVGDSTEQVRFADLRPKDEGLPLVHGHDHERWREPGRQLNVRGDGCGRGASSPMRSGSWSTRPRTRGMVGCLSR